MASSPNQAATSNAVQLWLGIALAGAAVFALSFGVRQSLTLFVGNINTATGVGLAAVSLAFACAQLWWGIVQPFAGAYADKYGSGRVLARAPLRTSRTA